MKANAEPITTDTWLTRGYVYTPLSRADDVLEKVQEYDESADFSLSAPRIPKGYIAIKVAALDAKTRNDLRSRVYHPCNLRKSRFSVSHLMWSDYMAYPIMDVNVYPSDNDISDAEAAEIIHEQIEAAAIAEQDAAYTAEIAAKCAAIGAQGLQIVSELRVGDRLYSWHKAWCDKEPRMHFHGVVMTPPDEYGRLITNFYGVYNLAPSIVNLNNWQAPYYVQRSAYQWSSANTRYTVDLMEQMTPAQETEFWRTFNTRLDSVIDALAPDMLDETERRKLAFVETRNADTRVMAIESEQAIKQEAA